jgi:hypothetical protein
LGRSGVRLTAVAYQSGDAVQFRHFHDEFLDIDCRFGVDGNGKAHCFPQRELGLVYLDAACQEPAVRERGLELGQWFVEPSASCPEELLPVHEEAWVVGEEQYAESIIGQESYQLYEQTAEGCVHAQEPAAKTNPPVHRVERKAPSELVGARVATFTAEGGLRVKRVIADDGAEGNLGITVENGTTCSLNPAGVCLPDYLGASSECAPPPYSAAQSDAALRDVGTGPLHLSVYELETIAENGRKTTLWLPATEVGEFLNERADTCRVFEANDGSLRCVTSNDEAGTLSGYFADATCEQPLYVPYDTHIAATDAERIARLRFVDWSGEGVGIGEVSALQVHQGDVYTVGDGACGVASRSRLSRDLGGPAPLFTRGLSLGIASLPQVLDTRLP